MNVTLDRRRTQNRVLIGVVAGLLAMAAIVGIRFTLPIQSVATGGLKPAASFASPLLDRAAERNTQTPSPRVGGPGGQLGDS